MRILFTSFPGLGHLHPLIPLALAAQAAGHEVRLATGPTYVEWVRRCGVDARPVGLGEAEVHEIVARDRAGPRRADHMFTDVWVPLALPDLLELARSWPPDVVVHEEAEFAGVLLAALLDVACVTQSWSAPARAAASRAFQSARLDPLWEYHLPRPAGTATSRRLGSRYLDACPAQFQAGDLDDIARTTAVLPVRPGLFDGPATKVTAWLADLARPAVYVTLGTVSVFSTPDRLRHVVAALAPDFASVVATSGPNTVESIGSVPANVRVLDYLPQSQVLPWVDLVVSHGGAGGSIGVLAHGLPHLLLPANGESQQRIAAAVQRMGSGLSLPEGGRDGAAIRQAAARLLSDPSFAAAAGRIWDELDRRPGPADVVRVLESAVG